MSEPPDSAAERERRRFPRILTDIDVEFDCMGVKTVEKANVLGGGGMFVITNRADLVGAVATVKFQPSSESPLMEARGHVCYLVPGVGMGVEFSEIRKEDREQILRLIFDELGERRTSKRASVVTQIKRVEQRESMVGYSKDVSVGGIFIETEDALSPGKETFLRFKLKPDGPILETRAVVIYRIERYGMALKFIDLAADTRLQIQAFINEQES